MARALGLALALVLLAAPPAEAGGEPSGALLTAGEETVLRLHDLPPGYRIGDDSGCGALSPSTEGETPGPAGRRYLRWIATYWPEGCFYEYEQLFRVPNHGPAPPQVEAETTNTPSEAAAARGFELFTALIERRVWRERETVAVSPGTEGVLIRSRDQLVAGKTGQPGSFILWRYGSLIAVVSAEGGSPRRNDRAVLRFAQIQQSRLEAPTPYTEEEQDDAEVALDDPTIGFPIYWVGSEFAPGHGVPPTALEDAFTRYGPPGIKTELWYEDFDISSWTEASWKRFAASALGPVNLHARCTSEEPLALPDGSAMVYATFDRRFRRCPTGKPDRFFAIARLGRMVVGVNLSNCLKCRPGASGPYGSRQAVVAILRALKMRPKPVY